MALPTRNGSAINKAEAYADRIIERLDQIAEHTEYRENRSVYRYERGGGTSDSVTGVLEVRFTVQPGALWEVQRATFKGAAGPGGFGVFLNEVNDQNRIDYGLFDANGLFARQSADPLYFVPGASTLIVQFFGAASTICAVMLLAKELVANE